MQRVYFITHPEVVIDPHVPVPEWPLSEKGRERMNLLIRKDWVKTISAIYCSTEQKAVDGAQILANAMGQSYTSEEELGENDRSSTGYVPKDVFESMADRFFASPYESVVGWERAADAQNRIVNAVSNILRRDTSSGSIAIVSHGGVGALLLCHLLDTSIDRSMDQPGSGGGNVFCFEKDSRKLIHTWRSIEDS